MIKISSMDLLGLTKSQIEEKAKEMGTVLLQKEVEDLFHLQLEWEKKNVTEEKNIELARVRASKKQYYTLREFEVCINLLQKKALFGEGLSMFISGIEFEVVKARMLDHNRKPGQTNVSVQFNYPGGVFEDYEDVMPGKAISSLYKDYLQRIHNRGYSQSLDRGVPDNVLENPFE